MIVTHPPRFKPKNVHIDKNFCKYQKNIMIPPICETDWICYNI